jgi:hypothetical protein
MRRQQANRLACPAVADLIGLPSGTIRILARNARPSLSIHGRLSLGGLVQFQGVAVAVGQAGHAQVQLELEAERAGVGQAERGRKLVEGDHAGS